MPLPPHSRPVSTAPAVLAFLALVLVLVVAGRPVEAVATAPSPTEVFGSRCNVEGSFRTIPLHPDLGGSVPVLIKGVGSVVELDEPIPAGSYRVSYLSYDAYPGRLHVYQPDETWDVQFFADDTPEGLQGTVGPTADLADFVVEAFEFAWPDGAVTTITTDVDTTVLAVRHAAAPGSVSVNSVRPICINLFPIDSEPIPVVPGKSCAGAELVARNPNTDFGSSFGKVWRNAPSQVLAEFDPPLPAGSYRLIGSSYDGYVGRTRATWERSEIWVAEFRSVDDRLLAVSGPSEDLPDGDGYEEARWEGSMGRVMLDEPTGRIVVRHAAPATSRAPNSLYADCLGLTWDQEPSLADIMDWYGLTTRYPHPGETFPAGVYDIELLAEFSSGHATNAVGYHLAGSAECTIVLEGSIGGLGLTATGGAQITVDQEFGLCLAGKAATYYTESAVNADGIRAADIYDIDAGAGFHVVGFEDYIDGDFQDLVVSLKRSEPSPQIDLPEARPVEEVPWSEVTSEWLLTIVSGETIERRVAQGLYLVNPDGERWAIHTSVRDNPGGTLWKILDWEYQEALVLVSGPRDIGWILLFDLTDGTSRDITGLIGFASAPKMTFVRANAPGLFTDLIRGPQKQMDQLTYEGGLIASFGDPVPEGTLLDWINAPGPPDFVITDGLDRAEGPGRITFVERRTTDVERVVAYEECSPVRWLRSDELVAVCDGVGDTTGQDLWVVPMDGSPMWPVVAPDVTASLGVDGFRDLYLSDNRLFLESAAGEIWVLEEGCGVPFRSRQADLGRLDLLGSVGDDLLARDGSRLVRFGYGSDTAVELLDRVDAVIRGGNDQEMTTGGFPAPPRSPGDQGDTCSKQGSGTASLLTDIRWGRHPDFTRVVFDFQAEAQSFPNWVVQYVDGPIQSDVGAGATITGDGLLFVLLVPSSTVDLSDPDNTSRTYTGPINIDVGVGSVEAIDMLEDFESVLRWVITLDERRPFSAFTLTNPPRLVIDVASD